MCRESLVSSGFFLVLSILAVIGVCCRSLSAWSMMMASYAEDSSPAMISSILSYALVVEFSVRFFALSMPMQPVSAVASYLLIWELESRGLFCPSKVLLMTARLAETAL